MDAEGARERMLRLWAALADDAAQPRRILTTTRTVLEAASIAPNAKQTLFAVTDLVTPLGVYPHAVLREREVVQIEAQVSAATLKSLINT